MSQGTRRCGRQIQLAGDSDSDSNSKQRRQRQFEFFGLIINAWCFGDFICIFLRSGKNKKNKKSKKNNTKEKKKKKVNNSNNKVGDIV